MSGLIGSAHAKSSVGRHKLLRKAVWRSALIVVAGSFVGFSSPASAQSCPLGSLFGCQPAAAAPAPAATDAGKPLELKPSSRRYKASRRVKSKTRRTASSEQTKDTQGETARAADSETKSNAHAKSDTRAKPDASLAADSTAAHGGHQAGKAFAPTAQLAPGTAQEPNAIDEAGDAPASFGSRVVETDTIRPSEPAAKINGRAPASAATNSTVGAAQGNAAAGAVNAAAQSAAGKDAQAQIASAGDTASLRLMSLSPESEAAATNAETWEKTSLIGKLFVGFGALLMLGSAVRMMFG